MITDPEIPEKAVQSVMRTALFSFWISLSIGTLLILLYLFKVGEFLSLLLIGATYVWMAAFANTIILINLLLTANLYKEFQRKLYLRCALLLLNVPIACAYFLIVSN